MEGLVVLPHKIDKVLIEVDQITDQCKVKIVQGLIIELQDQFVLELQIEAVFKIDLEFLPGQQVVQTVLIIVQVFHLA